MKYNITLNMQSRTKKSFVLPLVFLFSGNNFVLAAHVRTQCFGDIDRAVSVEVVFKECDEHTGRSNDGVIEGVREIFLAVCAFYDHVVGIEAALLAGVIHQHAVAPVNAVGGVIHHEITAAFTASVENVHAVNVCGLRIARDFRHMGQERLTPCHAAVFADEAGEVVLIVHVVAVEDQASVGTKRRLP